MNEPAGRRRNSHAAPAWAADNRVGHVGTKAVLLVLARYADDQFSCYPGQQTIADETEQSVRQVRRQIGYLEEIGLITRTRRFAPGGYRSSDRYQLNLDVVVDVGRDDPRRALLRNEAAEPPTGHSGRSDLSDGVPVPEPPTGHSGRSDLSDGDASAGVYLPATGADLPATEYTPTGHWVPTYRPLVAAELLGELPGELPEKKNYYPAPADAGARPVTAAAADPPTKATTRTAPVCAAFEAWYAAYPLRKGKGDAERKWALAVKRGATPEELLAGAVRYRDDPTRDPAYTLHPKTWLHGGHWADEGPTRPQSTRVPLGTRGAAGMTEETHRARDEMMNW